MTKQVGILIFDDAEVLDFAGPFEVFSVSKQIHEEPLFNVFTIAINEQPVKAINGLRVIPDYTIHNHPEIQILILSGGSGSRLAMLDNLLLDWINNIEIKLDYLMSVCSGTRFLAKLGFLNNRSYCTHHQVYEHIQELDKSAIPQKQLRYCETTPKIITTGGISAGIDASFYLIKTICGEQKAVEIAEYMEYNYTG